MSDLKTIESLPNEILEIILEYAFKSSDPDKLNLLLVSKHWKDLIESRQVFQKSTFFEKLRTEGEFQTALVSCRCYKAFAVKHDASNPVNPDWIEQILNTGRNYEEAQLTFEMAKEMDFKQFHQILKSLRKAKKIRIDFQHLKIQENLNFDRSVIKFDNLEEIIIDWSSGQTVIGKFLLDFMITPKLKRSRLDSGLLYGFSELNLFFEFINRNSEMLESVYIWSRDSYGFEWNPELLHIWYRDAMQAGLERFMQNRIKKLKTFKIHWMHDQNYIARIFEEATNLEEFETSEQPPYFTNPRTYRNLKMFTLWYFYEDLDVITTIQTNFPNLEVIRFAYGEVSEETKGILRSTFSNLKEIRHYTADSNGYALV
jgi:hypothetical protein